jgi:hypothetical protein
MNTFNKKSLCVALAATGMLGAAGVAQAVNVSENGLGNVLIYPYYTVNKDINGNSYNTLMSVVNTTSSTKAIKVRFREGKNSVEVLDFNVFLSPFDVWTASITPSAAGGGHIATSDKSCTIPTFPAGGTDFRTSEFESTDNGVARTAEGYFEVFEMATYPLASLIGIASKHVNGVPPCGAPINDTTATTTAQPPQGGLFGGVVILSPAGGGAFSQNATALANFSTAANYQSTGSDRPNYSDAFPPISNVITGGLLYQSDWTGVTSPSEGDNAVTAVLLADRVTNEYALDAGSKSQTTWIMTFPTKYAYVNGTAAPIAPFTQKYLPADGACESFFGVVFDREENSPQIVQENDFSPQPGPAVGPALCWEAQSLGFGTSNVFGSRNHNTLATSFSNGWAVIGFNGTLNPLEHSMAPLAGNTATIDLVAGGLTAGQSVTYFGLPVVGFAAETFQNDAVVVNGKTYLSTFGVTFQHHSGRVIGAPPAP